MDLAVNPEIEQRKYVTAEGSSDRAKWIAAIMEAAFNQEEIWAKFRDGQPIQIGPSPDGKSIVQVPPANYILQRSNSLFTTFGGTFSSSLKS